MRIELTLIYGNLRTLNFPSAKDALCEVWLKLPQLYRRLFLKVINILLPCGHYFPLQKGVVLQLNKFE